MAEAIKDIVVRIRAQKEGFESLEGTSESFSGLASKIKEVESATISWNEFIKGKMGPYMAEAKQRLIDVGEAAGKTGSELNKLAHNEAMSRLSIEFKEYKAQIETANTSTAKLSDTLQSMNTKPITVSADISEARASLNDLKVPPVTVTAELEAMQMANAEATAGTLPPIKVGTYIDTSQAETALAELKSHLQIPDAKAKVLVDSNIAELKRSLEELDNYLHKSVIIDKGEALTKIAEVEKAINELPKESQLSLNTAQAQTALKNLKVEMNASSDSTANFSERISASAESFQKVGEFGLSFMHVLDRIEISQLNVANAQIGLANAQERYNTALSRYGENSREAYIAGNELARAQNIVEKANLRAQISTAMIGVTMMGQIPAIINFGKTMVTTLRTVELSTAAMSLRLKALAPELLILGAIAGGMYYLTTRTAEAKEATDALGVSMTNSFSSARDEVEKLKNEIEGIKETSRDYARREEQRKIKYEATVEIISSNTGFSAEDKTKKLAEEQIKYQQDILEIAKQKAEYVLKASDEEIARLNEELKSDKASTDAAKSKTEWEDRRMKILEKYKSIEESLAKSRLEEQKTSAEGFKGLRGEFASMKEVGGIGMPKMPTVNVEIPEIQTKIDFSELLQAKEEEKGKLEVNVTKFLGATDPKEMTEPKTEYEKYKAMTPEQQQQFRVMYPSESTYYGTRVGLEDIWNKLSGAWDRQTTKQNEVMDRILNQSKTQNLVMPQIIVPAREESAQVRPINIVINNTMDSDALADLVEGKGVRRYKRGYSE